MIPARAFSVAGAAVGLLVGGVLLSGRNSPPAPKAATAPPGVMGDAAKAVSPSQADLQVQQSSAEEARRQAAEAAAGGHPVVKLLDARFNVDAPDFAWDNARETVLRQIAASPEAAAPGAAKALWAALQDGRMEAGAVLWQLEGDPKVVEFIAHSFDDPKFSHLRDQAAFVLGWIREERVLDVLWKQLRQAGEEEDPYGQVALARAVGRIRRDNRARQILEKIQRQTEPAAEGELDRSPAALAEAALKDLE